MILFLIIEFLLILTDVYFVEIKQDTKQIRNLNHIKSSFLNLKHISLKDTIRELVYSTITFQVLICDMI